MSFFVDQAISDDFIWQAVTSAIAGQRKKNHGKFISICCPMCVSRGESQDKRFRCGITNNNPGVGIHCFNCGFKARQNVGDSISKPMRAFMLAVGVSENDVKKLNLRALGYKRMLHGGDENLGTTYLTFPPKMLPPKSKSLSYWVDTNCDDEYFIKAAEYLCSRGEAVINSTEYYWSPDNDFKDRLIIPFYRNDDCVGWTARSTTNNKIKYISDTSLNYLFNNKWMYHFDRKYIVLVEGIFDALAIDAVSTMGAKLNPKQASWLESTGKKIIVVPDRDISGQRLTDIALQRKWMVSFPGVKYWHNDVKDAADASKRYGKLYTIYSIMESATDDALKINLYKKMGK